MKIWHLGNSKIKHGTPCTILGTQDSSQASCFCIFIRLHLMKIPALMEKLPNIRKAGFAMEQKLCHPFKQA